MGQVRVGAGFHRWFGCGTAAVVVALLALPMLVVRAEPLRPVAKPAEGKDDPAQKKENSNSLLKDHRDKVKVTASSAFGGYPPELLIDGKQETSWFSTSGDSAAKGKKPWVELEFPDDVTVSRVTLLGNRDPGYPKNYSILTGGLELLDKDHKRLWYEEGDGAGDLYDFNFRPKTAVKGVRYIRFTSLKDQGDKNNFGDVALGEILAE